eukprot:CAMPEP_0197290848 /NCGR_PEP_ID=MMETSP0890-20130614/10259_1 /TAXON_ID=44058 ORGANISM="Aureoumbra lagunensis, Strain CCMP1510" /NCGR_SAMPLE_ID=MMETSP0890 /ASSEMBLY_ACC=CAM_ASM_000533 /LENGTH=211 /DNA_ID=CAMNT_0042763185 /DNA_START=25 /DNA_END=660 /DNA_ORIENTATION=+
MNWEGLFVCIVASVHGFEFMNNLYGGVKRNGKLYVLQQNEIIDGMEALAADAYIAMGLAKVYKTNDDGGVDEMLLIEPLTAGTLETLELGVPTSYCRIMATTIGEILDGDQVKLDNIQALIQDDTVSICENMSERAQAAARTFRRRPEAQILDIGSIRDDFNFNTDRKRVIDQIYEPSFDDNVKQHASIDVYNRNDDDEKLSDEIKRLAET